MDKSVDEMFRGSSNEICYGHVRVRTVIFHDDILRLGDSLDSVKVGNINIDTIMNHKKLVLNADKTCFIKMLMGNDTDRRKAQLLVNGAPS